ncbi:FeoB small GTPase domain-containing protein [Paenibacillus sp. FA6]|uniref:FeoB small GTPase domain-containing protein n=1 Tax=Paenibacillus sp. FA6 TaxID=3413029 RepID=UPI003F65BB62
MTTIFPYSLEEIIARNYMLEENPDVVINIVNETTIERNLYLTTQLIELGLPVVVALNMMDALESRGDQIEKVLQLAQVATIGSPTELISIFDAQMERKLEELGKLIAPKLEQMFPTRWAAVRLLEDVESVVDTI